MACPVTYACLRPWFLVHDYAGDLFPFDYVLSLLGLSADDAAGLCGVSAATVRRWRRDCPPVWVVPLLLARCGFLLAEGWRGWRVVDGRLYRPGEPRRGLYFDGIDDALLNELAFMRANYTYTVMQNSQLRAELADALAVRPSAKVLAFPR